MLVIIVNIDNMHGEKTENCYSLFVLLNCHELDKIICRNKFFA